jgi:urease accessory protein
MNLAVLEELEAAHPGTDYAFVESGGDNLTLTFSPELVDWYLYMIDVAAGDKIPRKRGTGLILADLLVVNKIDLASYVGADLGVMEHDSRALRGGRPLVFTNCMRSDGIDSVIEHLEAARPRQQTPAWAHLADGHSH